MAGSAGREVWFVVFALGAALLGNACSHAHLRKFPDRPIAWHEHDDQHVAKRPARTKWWDNITATEMQALAREADRHLSLPRPVPAEDVNALDEVPCSTWFCPRNHLEPMSPEEIAAGPEAKGPPVPPLTVVEGKSGGFTPGFIVKDSRDVRYLLKLDPPGQVGLASGAEVVGTRLFHAAGYNVPATYAVRLTEDDMRVDPEATYKRHKFEETRFDAATLAAILALAGRDAEGRLSGMAVAWLPGKVLGGFDFRGRRGDDPNDRIPHEHRRSLRASYVIFGWLNVADA